MPLTLTDNFKKAFLRGDVETRFLVSFEFASSIKALNGLSDDTNLNSSVAPAVIHSISPISIQTDPITRHTQIGSVTIVVEQSFLRKFIVDERLKGKRVIIKLGARELAESDYVNYFGGIIEEISPISDTLIQLEVESFMTVLTRRNISTFFLHQHPLGAMNKALTKAGMTSTLVDFASLEPSNAEYSAISHFNINRASITDLGSDTSVVDTPTIDVINELCELLNGQFIDGEDGKLKFVISDPTAAVVATWDEDTIISLVQTEIGASIINQVEISFGSTGGVAGVSPHVLELGHQASKDDHEPAPGEPREYVYSLQTDWIKSGGWLVNALTDVSVAPFQIQGNLISVTGMIDICTTQDAHETITAARPLYIKIDDEIIKATSVTQTFSSCEFRNVYDPEIPANVSIGLYPYTVELSGITRGAFGTTAAAHSGLSSNLVNAYVDFTYPIYIAERILERHANGLDFIEVETNMIEIDKQIGELIKIVWPEFVSFGRDGLDSGNTLKFEILGKEPDVDATPPKIRWTLASIDLVTLVDDPFSTTLRIPFKNRIKNNREVIENNTLGGTAVISGFDIAEPGGLQIIVQPGIAANHFEQFESEFTVPFTLPMNLDHFIYVDVSSRTVSLFSQTIGQPSPIVISHQVQIGRYETDGAGIVVTDTANVHATTDAGAGQASVAFEPKLYSDVSNATFSGWSRK